MRLLNVRTRKLEEFIGQQRPPYAILSHTWGKDEVTFDDLKKPDHASKPAYKKIDGCCKQAVQRDLKYVWADNCCIDKANSSELAEAINSMYAWYRDADVCCIYLEDVHSDIGMEERGSDFRKSRWFTRGWTLQELLAPRNIYFFDSKWNCIVRSRDLWRADEENMSTMTTLLSEITGVPAECLSTTNRAPLHSFSVAQRMSWMKGRSTTKEEDMAYCLLGIFRVNMPLVYGEGKRAFLRLQEEIIRTSPDQTLFCWGFGLSHDQSLNQSSQALSLSPESFANFPRDEWTPGGGLARQNTAARRARHDAEHFTMTNQGVLMKLPIEELDDENETMLAVLDAGIGGRLFGLVLSYADTEYSNLYARAPGSMPILLPKGFERPQSKRSIYIDCSLLRAPDPYYRPHPMLHMNYSWSIKLSSHSDDVWQCYGWYPPMPLMVHELGRKPVHQLRAVPHTSQQALPSEFLMTFSDGVSTVLCRIEHSPSEPGGRLNASLAVVDKPRKTPMDFLHSARLRQVTFDDLTDLDWVPLEDENAQTEPKLAIAGSTAVKSGPNRLMRGYFRIPDSSRTAVEQTRIYLQESQMGQRRVSTSLV